MKAKFKVGDVVKFTCDGHTYKGKVYIVDYGTFEFPDKVSYDIMTGLYKDDCLFKHILEKDVTKV